MCAVVSRCALENSIDQRVMRNEKKFQEKACNKMVRKQICLRGFGH
jgi:hypothetical protein